jgi:hypothetical protein
MPIPNNDISITLGEDRRLLYTLCSCGAILLLFVGLVLWTLHTASLEVPLAGVIQESDIATGVGSDSSADTNGKKDADSDEDHEPAVI